MATQNHSSEYVHRATDEFPAGHECELTAEDVPDDESAFGWTDHYEAESRTRSDPSVTEDIVDQLLTDSAVREAPGSDWDNRYLFQTEIDGYEWTLVVADDGPDADQERWVLITIYSNYHGAVGTTNRYFDRLQQRRGEN